MANRGKGSENCNIRLGRKLEGFLDGIVGIRINSMDNLEHHLTATF